MIIKRIIVLSGIIIAVALILPVMYSLINNMPLDSLNENLKVITVFEEASCITCHQKNSRTSFYIDIPFIGQLRKNKQRKGYRKFNIAESIELIKKEEAVNEVSMAKIEWVTLTNRSMPPVSYNLTHWRASVNPAKQTIIRDWINGQRETLYTEILTAGRFKFEPVRPVPSLSNGDQKKNTLGTSLFFDKRLSADNTVCCASCHQPDKGGANNNQFATGAGRRLGNINTPALYNATFNIAQAWDGRAANIHDIIREHIIDPVTMGNRSFDDVINKLYDEKDFKQQYGDEPADETIIDAIAGFTVSLLTPDCRFDRYLKGDENAITTEAIHGYELFKSNKCAVCHTGITLGGQSFELMGIYDDYFKNRGWEISKEDLGRYNVTADEDDRYRFKVPGLRNVALTQPYFHDGSRQSLSEAVQIMGKYQSNKQLSDRDVRAIVAFLETL